MTFNNRNGRPGTTGEPGRGPQSLLLRYPYAAAVIAVMAAGLCVFIVDVLVGFPPLIVLAGAAAVCVTVLGVRAGAVALVFSALISDFFFVEPVLTLTRNTFILGAFYSLGALICRRILRKPSYH
jgi:K+-sensing histidine kinase KdpD